LRETSQAVAARARSARRSRRTSRSRSRTSRRIRPAAVVLLPEERVVRADEVEQLGHHGEPHRRSARPGRALQLVASGPGWTVTCEPGGYMAGPLRREDTSSGITVAPDVVRRQSGPTTTSRPTTVGASRPTAVFWMLPRRGSSRWSSRGAGGHYPPGSQVTVHRTAGRRAGGRVPPGHSRCGSPW